MVSKPKKGWVTSTNFTPEAIQPSQGADAGKSDGGGDKGAPVPPSVASGSREEFPIEKVGLVKYKAKGGKKDEVSRRPGMTST